MAKSKKTTNTKNDETLPKQTTVENLSRGDLYATHRGARFRVVEIDEKQKGDFHHEERTQYSLLVQCVDDDDRVMRVTSMDTDAVLLLERGAKS